MKARGVSIQPARKRGLWSIQCSCGFAALVPFPGRAEDMADDHARTCCGWVASK